MRTLALYLTLAALPGGSLQAQQAPLQGGPKVGVVNLQAVLAGTREGRKVLEQLKTRLDTRKKDFEARQNEILQLQDRFDKGGAVMTDEKRKQLADAIGDKKKRLERDMQDAQDEFQRDQEQTLEPVGTRVDATIGKFAAGNGYSVVFDYSAQGNNVRYIEPGVDITKDVIALYDKTYGDGPAPGKP